MRTPPGSQSVVDRIQATVVSGRWCRPPFRTLIYNNFDLTTTSILLMIFSSGSKQPDVVVKLCRDAGVVKREFENLCAIRDHDGDLAPAPLFFDAIDAFGVLGMKAVPGRPLSVWGARLARLPAVVDRLVAFHRSVQGSPMDLDRSLGYFREPFETIGRLGHDVSVERAVVGIGQSLAPLVQKAVLPRIPQHGDLCFNNILLDGSRISFVDWEDFGQVLLPGYDLFCLFLSFYVPGEPERLWRDDRLRQSLRSAVDAYFAAISIPKNLAGAMLAFSVVQQFVYGHRLGRSSAEALWQRVVSYVQHEDRFRQLLEE
jgi:hypothetical protein